MKPNVLLIANCRAFSPAAPLEKWIEDCMALLPDKRLDMLVVGKNTDPTAAALRGIAERRNIPVFELDKTTDAIADTDTVLNEITHAVTLWDGKQQNMIGVIALLRTRGLLLKRYTYYADNIPYEDMRSKRRVVRQNASMHR